MLMRPVAVQVAARKSRVYVVAAEDPVVQEVLSPALTQPREIKIVCTSSPAPFQAEKIASAEANIRLLASRGKSEEDVPRIRAERATLPEVRILLLAKSNNETEFLRCVRARINGYLARSASA
jgi:DNA-binding NarL/FixJ family response regulator